MNVTQRRRLVVEDAGNPFLRGPCFVGPKDHRFCRGASIKWPVALPGEKIDADGGPVYYADRTFRCPCPCGHPEPPAIAKPGRDMQRVMDATTTFEPPPPIGPRTKMFEGAFWENLLIH